MTLRFPFPGARRRCATAATALHAIATPDRVGAIAAPARRRAVTAALILALGATVAPANAERADRTKPTLIESDSMQYDDVRQTNVFTGSVVLTKGSLVIRADRLVLRQDPDGYQQGSATGNPASFRQKRDGIDQFIVGSAQQIDYEGKTETIRLRDRAQVRRLERERVTDEIHGSLIVYDSRSELFSVESGGARAATPENPGGRVRVVIQPRTTEAPAAAVPLKPAERMGKP
jgi:lipopolysaccharide export system protein LptA